ncbi:hypothetical protein Misp03_39310 [Microbispora sp. NBRC 16548]|nr:hypothetical protein Misp03_39310 [Microbispora sp. NBRC 16548]
MGREVPGRPPLAQRGRLRTEAVEQVAERRALRLGVCHCNLRKKPGPLGPGGIRTPSGAARRSRDGPEREAFTTLLLLLTM